MITSCVEVEEVLGNSLIEKVIRKGKCTAVVTSTWSGRENQRNTTAARVRAGDAASEKGRFDGFGVLTGCDKRSMGRGLRTSSC